MEEAKNAPVKFPTDVEGAEYLFVAPVSDYMMEAETLMGIACVMHATGASWTIGTKNYDAINYGLFYSDQVLERLVNNIEAEAERLGCKKILIGECGHASRSAKYFYNNFAKHTKRPIINILEYTYDALKAGKLNFDTSIITQSVTYHDPCNIARQGWIIEQPREIIKAFIPNFIEMTPNRRDNYCCGGGGGSVSIDELRPYRTTVSGRKKAEQIAATGADMVIAPCANCKKQVRETLEDNEVATELVGLHDLIYKALILSPDGVAWREPSDDMDWMGGDEDFVPPQEAEAKG
ncbi:succinate dehydrogenase/fumarate reductase iron-sulfur subunit [bacterium BMS3Bbin04]|nr:succinate dehydrogenase/fumarate reductase iron-sulfur subunit [bacterium BMS3Bbin04]